MPQNDFTRNMIDFDTFAKFAYECGRFGQIQCCQRLLKVAQSPINCPIWSHWLWLSQVDVGPLIRLLMVTKSLFIPPTVSHYTNFFLMKYLKNTSNNCALNFLFPIFKPNWNTSGVMWFLIKHLLLTHFSSKEGMYRKERMFFQELNCQNK